MLSRLATLLASLLMIFTLVPGPAQASLQDSLTTYMINRVDAVRAAHGLGPLWESASMQAFAQRHSEDMRAGGAIYHGDIWPFGEYQGQNVGFGGCVCGVEHAFEISSEHRANLLDPNFHWVGYGFAQDANGGWYVTQQFSS